MGYFFFHFEYDENYLIEILNKCLEINTVNNTSSLKILANRIIKHLSNGYHFPETMKWINKNKDVVQFIENFSDEVGDDENKTKLRSILKSIDHQVRLENFKRRSDVYNSEDFYKAKIEKLQEEEQALSNELDNEQEESDKYKAKERELEEKKGQIKQLEHELEALNKKIDASDTLKNSINVAFDELKKHTKPLKVEKKRLNWLFGCYALLSIFVLVLLVIFECKYLSKWETTPKSWTDYLPYYIPVPIVGALLWAFIYQMNRAQRQLVLLANKLYHIDYVEELLLAITNVSPNVSIAAEKISQVLDQMIRIYIKLPNDLSEETIEKAISKDSIKDSINLQSFLDLAKEVKDVIK